MGIIAGAMGKGGVNLYDPAKVVCEQQELATINSIKHH